MRTHLKLAPTSLETTSDSSHEEASAQSDVQTEFHVTGFDRFFNVPINPTELIVQRLSAYLAEHPLKSNASLRSSSVLPVVASTTRTELEKMYTTLERTPGHQDDPGHARVVFVHLGVNMRTTRFQLEQQAKNEATFSCPDEGGWAPVRVPIDACNKDITSASQTSLNVASLVTTMKERGFDVEPSRDAGRFVCNWVYYNSLQLARSAGAHALFVHVPPATHVPIERQVEFIASLLDCLATQQGPSFKPRYHNS